MSRKTDGQSKYFRAFTPTQLGILPVIEEEKIFSINTMRVSVVGNATLQVRVRTLNELTFTDLEIVLPDTSVLIDVSTWDYIQYEVTAISGTPSIFVSGFFVTTNTGVEVTVSITPRGAYNGALLYNVGDLVFYDGETYIALVQNTGVSVTDPTTWANFSGSSSLEWNDYALNVEYTGTETAIATGNVLEATYQGSTVYRFINSTNNANGYPTEDSFYSSFDGTTLSGLLAQRGLR